MKNKNFDDRVETSFVSDKENSGIGSSNGDGLIEPIRGERFARPFENSNPGWKFQAKQAIAQLIAALLISFNGGNAAFVSRPTPNVAA